MLLVITMGAVWVDFNRDVESDKTPVSQQESNGDQAQLLTRSFIFNTFDNNKMGAAESSGKRLFLRTLNKFLQRHHNMQAFQLQETSIAENQPLWVTVQYIHFHQRFYQPADGEPPLI
ncbi:hypothetical protein EMN47_05820 [Prolixibacteraceae bacterium JC049]|nr:hypothetical protein [Prolixibacteraceae bacterium JC049]